MRWFALASAVLVFSAFGRAGATVDLPRQCEDDRDCAPYPENPWCGDGFCGRCQEDTDCTGLDEVCTGGACVVPCVDAMDCTAAEPICHPTNGICAECVDSEGCPESEFCGVGLCAPDECAQGETRCASFSRAVAICNADGSGWDVLKRCDVDCVLVDGVAQCEGEGTTSGASGSTSAADASTDGTTSGGGTMSGGSGVLDDASSKTGAPGGNGGATNDGCGCRAASDATGFGWLLLALVRRRRRARPDRRRAS